VRDRHDGVAEELFCGRFFPVLAGSYRHWDGQDGTRPKYQLCMYPGSDRCTYLYI